MVKYYTDGSSALAPDEQEGDTSRDQSASYRPNFRVIDGGKSGNDTPTQSDRSNFRVINGGKSDDNPDSASSDDQPNLRAVNSDRSGSSSTNDLRQSEDNALSNTQPSFYRGSGKSDKSPNPTKKIRFRKTRKGMAGLILSLALLTGGGAFLAGSNSLLGPAFNEVVTEITDLQHASDSARSARLIKFMMEGEDAVKSDIWTGSKKYANMSESFQKRLASNGIEVKGTKANRTFEYKGNTITADEFNDYYKNDLEFRDSYNRSRRSRIMGFFDNIANKIYSKLNLSRNAFKNYKQSNDAEADTTKFRETMTGESDVKNSLDANTSHGVEMEDEDGNILPINEQNSASADSSGDDARTKAQNFIDELASGGGGVQEVTNLVSQVTGWGCTFMKLTNMVSVAVASMEIYQSINYFMGLAESPSKMKMGYGSESGINSMLNFITTETKEVEYDDYSKVTVNGNINTASSDGDFSMDIGTSKTSGSPIMSNGMQKIMTGQTVDTKMAKNFSFERSLSTLGAKITTAKSAFHGCAIVQTGSAIASIAITISTVGLSSIASYAMAHILDYVANSAFSLALSFIIPQAMSLFINIFEDNTGIPAGEMIARGAFAANTRVARSGSSLAPSSEEAIIAYNELNNEVLAMDAEVDRNNRSPFDITSRNTFLGSIAYSFATTSSTRFTGKIKNLMRTTSSSIANFTGTANAFGENTYITTYGDCPLLESIGVKGDMYCTPIPTTDVSTKDTKPNNEKYAETMSAEMTCDDEGNCKINEDGELAKYIKYCNDRDTPFGAVDNGILEDLKDSGGIIATFLSNLPLIGDVIDIFEAAQDEINMNWATGLYCSNTSENPKWETHKYFQRYVQDQRLLEQYAYEDSSENPVTAFLEEYEAKHPLDNSPSGVLARISGLSKENAKLVLAIGYYYNFLENYDPNTRIAMDGTASEIMSGEEVIAQLEHNFRYKDFEKNFESETPTNNSVAVVAEHIIYADVRNRSYAV